MISFFITKMSGTVFGYIQNFDVRIYKAADIIIDCPYLART